jgi:hypothetical protein
MTAGLSHHFSDMPLGAYPIVSKGRRLAAGPLVESIVLIAGTAAGKRREEAGFFPS